MKLRWWILGAAAAVAGSIFLVKHFSDGKMPNTDLVDNDIKNGISQYPSEMIEPEFDDSDFAV
jgi:hypothetical protein